MKKVMIFGGAGRVGSQIAMELFRQGCEVALVDILAQARLQQTAGRLQLDGRMAPDSKARGRISAIGGVDALDLARVQEVLDRVQPDLVVNYAIPFTWDVTKRLPNYDRISRAGLGAFTPLQVLTPMVVGRAIAQAGLGARFMVGNLPDLTVPILTRGAPADRLRHPVCGAGNVGLIQAAIASQVCRDREADLAELEVSLVAHHIHWVAPREPGYANDAPFMLQVRAGGVDITPDLGDPRELMNRAIRNHYEDGAAFSSTTGILAARAALALLDESGEFRRLHVPAPRGLPGGYPVRVNNKGIRLDLPEEWSLTEAIAVMESAQQRDGVQRIGEDGSVYFADYAKDILKEELGLELPGHMAFEDIEAVAREQMRVLQQRLG